MLARLLRCFDNPGALLALVVTALLSLGMVMVYSASGPRAGLEANRIAEKKGVVVEEQFRSHHGSAYFVKQVMWAGVGIALAFALLKLPIELLEKHATVFFAACIVLLLLVTLSPLGIKVNGARRWIGVGGFTLQPSEFAKLGLIIFMARMLAVKREEIRDFKKGFVPSLAVLGFFCALLVLQKDLGTIILSGTVVVGMWCLARMRMRHFATLIALTLPAMIFLVFQYSYRLQRILAYLDSEKYAMTYGYQLNQSLIAVGSGGVFGSGLGYGMQQQHFLSESHTDFIFAIVGEELGLIGAVSVCLLFLAYTLIGFRISYKAPDYFSALLAGGLTMMVGCAAFINFGVVTGLLPTKGLALPFFTYGGSSLLASLIGSVLLINISNYSLDMRGGREAI